MSPAELDAICSKRIAGGGDSIIGGVLKIPYGWKRPKGFPRGRLLSEDRFERIYSFDPVRLQAWARQAKGAKT